MKPVSIVIIIIVVVGISEISASHPTEKQLQLTNLQAFNNTEIVFY